MPRKGMRSIFFKPSSPLHISSSSSATPPRMSFCRSLMEDRLDAAEILISKWNSDSDFAKVTSLFHYDRQEASLYLKAVRDLHHAMGIFLKEDPNSHALLRAQRLLQTAMIRLQKEFYQILAINRDCLDPESVSARSSRVSTISSISDFEIDEISEYDLAGESITELERAASLAMDDLKQIADCMISLGYRKECVKIYITIRKSIVDEGIYRLNIEKFIASKMNNKIDWEVVDMKIENWLKSVKTAVTSLFQGERILCDNVFSGSDSVRESCFAEISRGGALALFGLPELVANLKKTPEKIFRTLDVYEAIADFRSQIESIFSSESTADVKNQAVSCMMKLGESIRTMLEELESAIQQDNSRSVTRGGGVHPLTRYVMNYLSLLGDYAGVLSDISDDWPLKVQSPLPASLLGCLTVEEGPDYAIAVRIAWLVLVLLCKVEDKAKLYKDASLSVLFLVNNLQYAVNKVGSSSLQNLLGQGWIDKHKARVKQYASRFESLAWDKVVGVLPEISPAAISPAEARKKLVEFGNALEETCRKQSSWVVIDRELREAMKASISGKLVPTYVRFYEKYRGVVRGKTGRFSVVIFAPDDLRNYLLDLFLQTE